MIQSEMTFHSLRAAQRARGRYGTLLAPSKSYVEHLNQSQGRLEGSTRSCKLHTPSLETFDHASKHTELTYLTLTVGTKSNSRLPIHLQLLKLASYQHLTLLLVPQFELLKLSTITFLLEMKQRERWRMKKRWILEKENNWKF